MEKSKIPTAYAFLRRDESGVYSEQDITNAMIRFARMHVERALREAATSSINYGTRQITFDQMEREQILNAYPLENIK